MKMFLDDCVYYGGAHGNRLWGRYAKRVYQVEKKIFSSGCIENMDFAQRVLKQLGLDGKRYLLECRYLDFEEKIKIASLFDIELSFTNSCPNGKIVYETSISGIMCSGVYGYVLFGNGRLYKISGKREVVFTPDSPIPLCEVKRNIIYRTKYEMIRKSQKLSNEVKNFISVNYDAIESLPSKADNLQWHDGWSSRYRFLNKQCEGYMMEYAESGKEIIKWVHNVESIFKKYGINLNPSYSDSVKIFLHKYLGILDEIDFDKSFEKGYDFLDSTEFGDSCVRFGFDILDGDTRWFIDDVGPRSFDELEDKQFLGSIIRSVWTYHKNAINKSEARFNTDWFRWAFARLEKLLKKEK